MLDLADIGGNVARRRRERGLSQHELARRAGVGRSTIAALETGRLPELGYAKLASILAVLGLDVRITEADLRRPTFDVLRAENDEAESGGLENDRDAPGLE